MNLIKVGDTIINLDNVTRIEKLSDHWVKVCTTAFNGDVQEVLDFTGPEAEELWQRLIDIERSGRP